MTTVMRHFLFAFLAAAIGLGGFAGSAAAADKEKIDRRVAAALDEFREIVYDGDSLLNKAKGILVFPAIKKGGIGIGGEGGSGALIVDGQTVAYYRTLGASFGFQLGFQVRRQVLLFMEEGALNHFRNSSNWEIGVDGSVALVTLDAGGKFNTETLENPVVGFVFDAKGLMYNLTLEGQKVSRIDPD